MDKKNYGLLSKVDSPADLRKLSLDQLPELCRELRQDIIDEVSVNPGHFASSLGVVELTVALHYVFNTPEDRIVWDVGHQAYGHKILTGRRDSFKTNRQFGGIRPFPSPEESEYDTFTCGHASNSISAALGMAVAARKTGNANRHVVAVIGDGAMSGGLAFEGLNNVSSTPNDLLVVLNDNDMSIDHAVGGMEKYLINLDTNDTYNRIRFKLSSWMREKGYLNDSRRNGLIRFNNALKSAIAHQQNLFEGMNIRYFGPFNGHDVINLVNVLRRIKDMKGPKLLHLHTVKGKGYKPAEEHATIWHAPGKFDAATGERIIVDTSNQPPKFQDVFGNTLLELARKNPHIVGVTPAMPTGCSMCIMMKEMPDRCFDVGIAEGHAVTFLRRNGQGRTATLLQHLQRLRPACLRQYHPRPGHSEPARRALPRPRRTCRSGRPHPPRSLRHCSAPPHPQPDDLGADGRVGTAQADVYGPAARQGNIRDPLSARTWREGGLAMPAGGD